MNTFRVVVIGAFIFFALLGVFFFAGFGGFGGSNTAIGNVVIWGTLDRNTMDGVLHAVDLADDSIDLSGVSYVEQDSRTYMETLVNAIAAGRGPDLFLLRDENIVEAQDKVSVLPYESYSERLFKETFVEGAEIFLRDDGILAVPFSVDPMLLYWNRSLLAASGVSQPPTAWDALFALSQRLTVRDATGNILQSTIPFGEYDNVTNAKEIIVALSRQAGSSLVARGQDGELRASLRGSSDGEGAFETALRFYTEFSNPTRTVYTWNSALPSSRQFFLAGDLAFYPGFASELNGLRQSNPNLNFGVEPFPQGGDSRSTFGSFLGLAVPNGARNPSGAFRVAFLLSGQAGTGEYENRTGLPPVRRDLLAQTPNDDIGPVFYESALIAHAWLDPAPTASDAILRTAIRDITSGRFRISGAADVVGRELNELLNE